MLVYQISVLETTAEPALQCVFGYLPVIERPTLVHLERFWVQFGEITEAEKIEYSQPSDARVTRNHKLHFQDLTSPDTVVLDRLPSTGKQKSCDQIASAKLQR